MNYGVAHVIAFAAHQGQKRADGEDYIQHPIRVSGSTFVNDDYVLTSEEITLAQQAALLHDVIEDCAPEYAEKVALAGFDPRIHEILTLLTRLDGMSYADYIKRLVESENKIAIAIKLGDLTDNINSSENIKGEYPSEVIKKFEELRTKRWMPAYDKLVKIWLDFPEIMEE
jgi:guanosine-3',5'-bis(diphosphate) 3'-pyrophosphohydrolase